MAEAILMPRLGETTTEGTIFEWLVAEGDEIELVQPIALIETDKAQVELESVAEGTLLKIVAPAGATVEAGTVIAYVGEPGEQV